MDEKDFAIRLARLREKKGVYEFVNRSESRIYQQH